MRIVVADATPLHYLILIDAIDVLPRLFEKIYIPREVCDELPRPATPLAVKTWMSQPPPWLEITSHPIDTSMANALASLDVGERAAIALAEFLHADLLLMDDRSGAEIAARRGLSVSGTLGVLDLASKARFVDLHAAFVRLEKTNFSYPPSLMELLLDEERKRRANQT